MSQDQADDQEEHPVAKLRRLCPRAPALAIILGSGFSDALPDLEANRRVPYRVLPGFPATGVAGHAGELVLGRLAGQPVIILRGRAHFYEGQPMSVVTFPIRVLAEYGVRDLLLTNAAGAINPRFRAGDFMVIEDHINLMGENPLRGWPESKGPRFLDLSQVYHRALRGLLVRAGARCDVRLRSGVYLAVSGPSYETPAEIRAFRKLGADAVGMSTVPEAIVARQCGLRVAGLSCLTNLAAGLSRSPLSHREVLDTASRVRTAAGQLLYRFAELYSSSNRAAAKDSD
jgi:purine-nucleoside phosphorylase